MCTSRRLEGRVCRRCLGAGCACKATLPGLADDQLCVTAVPPQIPVYTGGAKRTHREPQYESRL